MTSRQTPPNARRSVEWHVERSRAWLRELRDELGLDSDDDGIAYSHLRAVLRVLRDRLTVEEGAQLAAQLPELVRGGFYSNWNPSRTPETYHDVDTFLSRVASEAALAGETEASFVTSAVWRLLSKHVSQGELDDVLAVLPAKIRRLLEES